ncbi:MAG: MarR family transcriptional regulator [Promicromonosporaceae bacterium]|nr:MarR family transcriptional regulator [Promicromonosporaceae bacterium]
MIRSDRHTTLLGPLKRAHLAARSLADEVLAPHGITMAQYTLLRHLDDNPGISGAELARLVRVTPATVTAMLTGLEAHGLVERWPDPAGGRSVLTRATPPAADLLETVWPAIQWAEAQLLEGVDPEDFAAFRRVVTAVVDHHAHLTAPPRLGPDVVPAAAPATNTHVTTRKTEAQA